MKIYLAGTPEHNEETMPRSKYRLHSFAYMNMEHVAIDKKKGAEVALDSGAYSAFNIGTPIDIKVYIRFLEEYGDEFSWYANLDAMPPRGSGFEFDQEARVAYTVKETWKNQQIMEAAGLNPVPVFHHWEDEQYLKKYLDKYEFIALGGIVGKPKIQNEGWLTKLFRNYLCDGNGMPIGKYHSFGLVATWCLDQYPWWSADSSAWVKATGLNCIIVPRRTGKDRWDYSIPAKVIEVCNPANNPTSNVWYMVPADRDWIDDYLESEGIPLGESKIEWWPADEELPPNSSLVNENRAFTEKETGKQVADIIKRGTHRRIEIVLKEGVSNNRPMRRQLAANFYVKLGENYPWPKKFHYTQEGFFS